MTKTVKYIIFYITRITNWGYNVNFFMNQNCTNTRNGPQHQHITSTAPLTQDESTTPTSENKDCITNTKQGQDFQHKQDCITNTQQDTNQQNRAIVLSYYSMLIYSTA